MAGVHYYLYFMNRRVHLFITSSINFLLILLWTYAAASKLAAYEASRDEMLNQALPNWLEQILIWFVPLIELFTAGLLLFTKTRIYSIYLSIFLLFTFTAYIALVKLNYFDYVPCSCGGVIGTLTWEQHFIFNLFFILLAATGLLLETNRNELQRNLH